jgi:hypothetical protein
VLVATAALSDPFSANPPARQNVSQQHTASFVGRKSSKRYLRRTARAAANFAGPIGSQRYCVVFGSPRPKGPERSLEADSRVAQMTMIGFHRLFAASRERRESLSLIWEEFSKACSETTWMDALLFVSSSVAYTGTPSCWQYLFMLLRRRLLAFALVGPAAELASGVPKPKKPTDSGGGGAGGSCEASLESPLESPEGAGARDLSGRATFTVVPRPLLLRTWTVPPSDLTV